MLSALSTWLLPALQGALGLLFTYWLHAVLWAAAGLVARVYSAQPAALRHRWWKLALLGPCVTASLAPWAPWAFVHSSPPALAALARSPALAGTPALAAASPVPGSPASVWAWLALGGALALALGFGRFALAVRRLRRRLGVRKPVQDERVLRQLAQLRPRAHCTRVRLTESAELGSPLVLGLREVCLPAALLPKLADAELAAVLGHELAHLERRDGIWFPLAGLLQSVLWMQPLNHWIASHFRATAELACDDRAVALTQDRAALARALVHVAEHALTLHSFAAHAANRTPGVTRGPTLFPSMGGAGSAAVLRARVQRLVQDAERPTPAGARLLETAGLCGMLALCAGAALGTRVGLPQVASAGTSSASLRRDLQRDLQRDLRRSAAPEPTAGIRARLDALILRDGELQRLLAPRAAAAAAGAAHQFDPLQSELEQELRHVREEASWLEERLQQTQ